jgi:F-type H+-transporting ATPase subunit a
MLALAHRILALTLIVAALVLLPRVVSAGPQHHEPDHPPADKHAPEHGGNDAHHEEHAAHKEMTATDHVSDSNEFHLFMSIWPHSIHLPNIFGFQITKFMVLELIAAGLILIFYIPLAIRARSGQPVHGWYWNMFEVLLTFVRNEIAKPNLGEDQADRYLPFLWTLFLFILFNNLLGMFPGLGSATASIYVTGALAVIVFFAIHGSAILSMGSSAGGHGHGDHGHGHDHGHADHAHGDHAHSHAPHAAQPANPVAVVGRGSWRYLQSLWPHIDVPIPGVGLVIKLLVFVIEIVGILVRNAVLAVRLFANMFAGHMVLATILLFITMAANTHWALWSTITISSVLGIVALSLLELFVAFLQAFLASLFMGMAINPQH